MDTIEISNSDVNQNNNLVIADIIQDEIASRTTSLFEADFNVYADRGSNCLKSEDATN